jgi:O-antigen/teichoic acid export membrane protein
MKIISSIRDNYRNNPKANQVIRLFSVTLITIPIGIVTSIFLTRFLGPEKYGDYNFIASIFNFAIIFFTFGFFQASNRTLVLNHNKERAREYYGATLIILGGLFIIMSIFLYLYGIFDENLKEKGLQKLFLLIIPVSSIFLLMRYFETLFQADNRIKLLAQSRLMPKIIFGLATLVLFFFFKDVPMNKLGTLWVIFFCTQALAYLYIILKIKMSFKNFKKRTKEIWMFNKTFGLNVYLGSLFAVGFSTLTQVFIGYFGTDNSGVGFYSLALVFSMPLSFIPNTIATTHYKEFSQSKKVPKNLLLITLGLSGAALIAVWLLVPPFVSIFYGEEYAAVSSISYIVSFGVILYGMGDFFNRFLGANGQGKALRNSSFFVGAGLLIASLLLIPKWGEYGAAYAKLIAGAVYLIIIIYHYFKFINSNRKLKPLVPVEHDNLID